MRRAAHLAAGLAVAVAAAGAAGCGGGDAGGDGLTWAKEPMRVTPPRLPSDRIVMGRVRNGTGTVVHLDARRLVVRDGAGHRLQSAARFIASLVHPLYGAYQQPGFTAPSELARLGVSIYLPAGQTAPLYVSYRLRADSAPPVTVDLGRGRLALTDAG